MSRFEPAQLRCICGTEFEVTAADSLHITNMPQLREEVLRGELHVFPCPACGQRVRLDKLLAYTDFGRWQWFVVFPEAALDSWAEAAAFAERSFTQTVLERSPQVVKDWAPKLRPNLRAVFGLSALREKLLVCDASLDDRTVEALKLQLIEWYGLPYRPGAQLWFTRVERASGGPVEPGGDTAELQLVFAFADASGPRAAPPTPVAVPMLAYQRLAIEAGAVRAVAPVLAESIAVDFRIARAEAAPAA